MLEAMAGQHPSDPHSYFLPSTGFVKAVEEKGSLEGVRMAWRPYLGNTAIDRELLRLCETAARSFAEAGAALTDMADDFELAQPVFQVLWGSLLQARYGQYLKEHRHHMSETLLRQMDEGAKATGEEVLKAIFARTAIYRKVQTWFESADVLVMPTFTRTAVPIDHDFFAPITIENRKVDIVRKAWYPYTYPFNLSGNPAITLPAGFHSDGLPVAIQLVGRRGEDALLLKAAAHFEAMRPWAGKRPKLPELDG
jgi:aspartyl-tRNA(Asn)/glutamyl-tRNA(Gln) amidotransferase subunit A